MKQFKGPGSVSYTSWLQRHHTAAGVWGVWDTSVGNVIVVCSEALEVFYQIPSEVKVLRLFASTRRLPGTNRCVCDSNTRCLRVGGMPARVVFHELHAFVAHVSGTARIPVYVGVEYVIPGTESEILPKAHTPNA